MSVRMGLIKKISLGGAISVVLLGGYLWMTQVDNTITVEDERAITQLLGTSLDTPQASEMVFDGEVEPAYPPKKATASAPSPLVLKVGYTDRSVFRCA